jgi:ribonuclease HII
MQGTLSVEPYILHERSLVGFETGPVAGVDEVGRGALAGPLTAAAVILPPISSLVSDPFWMQVRDSKTIPERDRGRIAAGIRQRALDVSVCFIPPESIDQVGVGPANRMAMEGAISGLGISPKFVLLDAFATDLGVPQVSFMKGDSLSLSIAAASIVAKVARDQVMRDYDREFDAFGFARNKGYGARLHLHALTIHGPCPIHRFCFAPVRLARDAQRDAL